MLFREARTPPSMWTPPKILKRKNPAPVMARGSFCISFSVSAFYRRLLEALALDEERQALPGPRLARVQKLRGDGLDLLGRR